MAKTMKCAHKPSAALRKALDYWMSGGEAARTAAKVRKVGAEAALRSDLRLLVDIAGEDAHARTIVLAAIDDMPGTAEAFAAAAGVETVRA